MSTVTSKFQVTLPEEVREKFPIDVGQKIQWEVQGNILVGKRLPSLMDLAGCMKSDKPPATDADISKAWVDAAIARDQRTKKREAELVDSLIHFRDQGVDLVDAWLAATGVSSGLEVASFDRDFDYFNDVKRHEPL